jgi:GR25 family glycosyltransferase involved in LPS biosynthesis
MEQYSLLQNILYINLDYRVDRLLQINNEFKNKLNIESLTKLPERFPAIKHDNGAIGCTLSHIKCLELALERKYPYVFICEDDIEFLNPKHFLSAIQEFERNPPKDWNVFIVSGNIVPPYRQYNKTCINIFDCQTTTGYITHYKYYETLIKNYKEGLHKLLDQPNFQTYFAIDKYWKILQKSETWYMLYPVSVIQRVGYSDIENRVVDYSRLMLDVDKTYLFNKKMKFL